MKYERQYDEMHIQTITLPVSLPFNKIQILPSL